MHDKSVEKPSDIGGVAKILFNGNWQLRIAQELHNAGFEIDFNRLKRP